jgi:transcriptional regulator with XRE-family HTH domain
MGPELKKSTLTSEQVRAARMMLRWEQKDLAIRSGISLPNIKRIETIPGELTSWEYTIKAIKRAFEEQGIRFFNGHSLGLRLRKIEDDPNGRRRKSTPAVAARPSKPVTTVKKARAKRARPSKN